MPPPGLLPRAAHAAKLASRAVAQVKESLSGSKLLICMCRNLQPLTEARQAQQAHRGAEAQCHLLRVEKGAVQARRLQH